MKTCWCYRAHNKIFRRENHSSASLMQQN